MNGLEIAPLAGFLILTFLITSKTLLLKKRGVKVSVGNENPPRYIRIVFPVFFLLLFVWFFELAKPIFPFQLSILNQQITVQLTNLLLLEISGAVLIFLSLIFMALTLHHFKTSLRFGLNETNRGKLITRGIFSISRNPFFLSILFYFLGTAFIISNWFFIGFSVLAVISIHFFILKEEKFMKQHYGNEYEKYVEKVRRYF